MLYVEELIGRETVNTMPLATLDAFRDHGRVRGATVLDDSTGTEQELGKLANLGIDLNSIAEQLQTDGIASFAESYSKVVAALARKRDGMIPARRAS